MRDNDAILRTKQNIRNLISITRSRTEHMVRMNTVPSRPVDPIRIHQPEEIKRWWRVVLEHDKVKDLNLTVTFSDGETWDLRKGA